MSFFNAELGKTLMKTIFLKVLHRFPHPYLHFYQKWKNCRKIILFCRHLPPDPYQHYIALKPPVAAGKVSIEQKILSCEGGNIRESEK